MKNIKTLTLTALFAAFTCVATMAIRFQTPSFGYIHLGDSLVLLSAFLLGPIYGGLASGIGSMFADLFSGYAIYVPATFVIKALTAFVAGFIFEKFKQKSTLQHPVKTSVVTFELSLLFSGIVGELIMIFGYFLYQIFLIFISSYQSGFSLHSAVLTSASGIVFNAVQALSGIIISFLLYPILWKNPSIRQLLTISKNMSVSKN